jgi:hypothetical protein
MDWHKRAPGKTQKLLPDCRFTVAMNGYDAAFAA